MRLQSGSPVKRMREDLKRQILRYLTRHTSARDSAEGIRVWWLDRGCKATPPDVEEALAELVALGWVDDRGEGDVHLFGLLHAKMNEIREYLSEGPSESPSEGLPRG